MKNITMQVNYKKYNISMEDDVYSAFDYMDDINNLKKRCRSAILDNEYDREYTNGEKYLCSYTFISSYLKEIIEKNNFLLHRIDNNNFIVESEEK